jgi:hypothetical protein
MNNEPHAQTNSFGMKRRQVLLRSRRNPTCGSSRDAQKMDHVKHMYSVGWPIPKICQYIGDDKSYIEAAIHRRRAVIAAKEQSPFSLRMGLSCSELTSRHYAMSKHMKSNPNLLYM